MTRRVLITAGANGIGLVMARAFAALGDRVWVTDVDEAAVAALPPGIRGTVCDASSEAAMDLLFAGVARNWDGLDIAIANAGIKGPTAAIEEMPLEGWHQCLAVNLDGAMLLARGAADETCGAWGDNFHLLDKWPLRHALPRALCRGEMGCHRPHEDRGDGARAVWHPGECDLPGLGQRAAHRPGDRGGSGSQGDDPGCRAAGIRVRNGDEAADRPGMAVYLASDGARMVSGQALAVDGMTYNVDP